jgi:hypothetical protein
MMRSVRIVALSRRTSTTDPVARCDAVVGAGGEIGRASCSCSRGFASKHRSRTKSNRTYRLRTRRSCVPLRLTHAVARRPRSRPSACGVWHGQSNVLALRRLRSCCHAHGRQRAASGMGNAMCWLCAGCDLVKAYRLPHPVAGHG